MGFAIFGYIFFQHKYIFNRTSGSNINMRQLRKLWLQSTGASVLSKQLDQTKVIKLCCYEIVSDQFKRAEVKLSDSSKDTQVTGREVSSKFPKCCGPWLPSAIHSTLQIEIYHTSKIQAPTELSVYVCACPRFERLSIPLATSYVLQNNVLTDILSKTYSSIGIREARLYKTP